MAQLNSLLVTGDSRFLNTINGNSDTSTKAKELGGYFNMAGGSGNRQTSANITGSANGGIRTFVASTSMTTSKPAVDGNIIHCDWDNGASWSSQLAVLHGGGRLQHRGQTDSSGTWSQWYSVYSEAYKPLPSDIGALPDTTRYALSGSVGGDALNSAKVNNLTVETAVPSGAVFTDTWNALTGATSSANGTVGYINAVPPKAGYNTKFFRADGTWATPVGTTYANGTGITIGTGNAINHSNSITAKTTQAVYPIKIDAQGHITAVGTAATILALGNGASNAYYGDKGKTAYDHSQVTSGNPHNVTKSDVGLSNVGNFKAVSTVASQGLTDTEKSNARTNIGAGTSSLALGETSSTAYRGDRGKTAYTHATDSSRLTTATSSGLYKIASTAQGHIASLTAIEKADITGLGIPASDTTYANGTGITIGTGNKINHSNSVTAQTTQKVYPIKIDAQGHISAYGTSPTTLSGYGITDAKIASGVITLGSNTITPLTASSTLDATKLSGTIPSGCYTNTKNTAGTTNSTKKLYLAGAETQGANPQTYSDGNVYTTNGTLTSSKTDTKAIIARTGTGTAGSDKGSGVSPRYIPTKWTFNSGITVANGEVYFIKIPKAGGTYGVWCSLNNGTNYYPVAISSGKGRFTTHYGANTVIAITYESDGKCTCYPLAGGDATSDVTGIFRVLNDYDANTTYGVMSSSELTTGTVTASRVVRSDYLKSGINSLIDTKINGLDVTTSGAGASKTLTALSEANGKISATFGNISITTSQISDYPTSTSSNFVITQTVPSQAWTSGYCFYAKWGNVVQVTVRVQGTNKLLAAGADGFSGTFAGDGLYMLPLRQVTLIGYTGSTVLMGWVETDGTISLRASQQTQIGNGNMLYFTGTYII